MEKKRWLLCPGCGNNMVNSHLIISLLFTFIGMIIGFLIFSISEVCFLNKALVPRATKYKSFLIQDGYRFRIPMIKMTMC